MSSITPKPLRSFKSLSGPIRKVVSPVPEPDKEDTTTNTIEDGIPKQNQDPFDDDSFDWAAKPTKPKVKIAKKEAEEEEEELRLLSMAQFVSSFTKWYCSQYKPNEKKEVEENINDPFESADLSLDELKELFSQLPADIGDPEVLRSIYETVYLTDQLLKSLEQTPYVLTIEKEFFGQALSCLRASFQAHFLASPNFAESLSTLATFLYYRLTTPAHPPAPLSPATSSRDSPNTSEQYRNSGLFCNYCKEPGHTKTDCNKLKNLICYRCFETGHSGKWCPNDPLVNMENSGCNNF